MSQGKKIAFRKKAKKATLMDLKAMKDAEQNPARKTYLHNAIKRKERKS